MPSENSKSAKLSPREISALAIEQLGARFIFRKLGIVYDYRSEQIPSPKLPSAADIRAGAPNVFGIGSGLADCALNAALLFDGLTLQLELGIARPEDAKIYDRLIGGLIRLGTTAPHYAAVSGIGADGKSFYAQRDYRAALYWIYHAWRAASTSVLSPDSQTKIRSIAELWFNHLVAKPDAAFANTSPAEAAVVNALIRPAIFAVGNIFAPNANAKREKKANENFDFATAIAADTPLITLFNAQISLTMAKQILCSLPPRTKKQLKKKDGEEEQKAPPIDPAVLALSAQISEKMREIAGLARPHLSAITQIDHTIIAETPSIDWREAANGSIPWKKINHENEKIAEPLLAGITVLLAEKAENLDVGDDAENQNQTPPAAVRNFDDADFLAVFSAISSTTLKRIYSAKALCPLPLLHALGVEHRLWEKSTIQTVETDAGEIPTLVAKFLEADYDDKHPQQAGHLERRAGVPVKNSPPPKAAAKAPNNQPGNSQGNSPQTPNANPNRSGNAKSRNRRRRKR